MQILISTILAVGISVASFLGISNSKPSVTPEIREYISQYVAANMQKTELGASVLPIAGITYNLSGAGVSGSATSITLASLTIPQTGQKIVDADLSETFYITLEPGNRTRQEIVACTTVIQNANNTATFSGCSRGMSPVTPYTASTTLQFSHAGGSQVIFSDPPQLFNEYTAKKNQESIIATWTFDNDVMPQLDSYKAPTTSPQFATKGYVDAVAFSGAAVIDASETAAGVVELSTGLEAASSTSSGTDARLVLPASLATSTYNASTAGLKVVVTQNDGTIDSRFFPATTTISKGFATSTYIGAFQAWQIGMQKQIITTTGTSTFTRPEGITKLFVEVVGAGGGGGSCAAGASNASGGGGGGAGGYSQEIVDVSATTSIQTFVGAGGSAETAGQRTTFGTIGFEFLSATGGNAATEGSAGANGGIATGGDINVAGSGGGGGADDKANTSGADPIGGTGGAAVFGGGGNGSSNGGGGTGSVGGGGGGASCDNNSNTGGTGGDGIIIIRW